MGLAESYSRGAVFSKTGADFDYDPTARFATEQA